jgi:SAM-dependent methyltransferase/uncharacterized protein YbaR (Trm112 family)
MTFVQFPFSLLRCPYCHNDLKFTSVPQPDQNVNSYGILECGCYKYPVIDGVPVIRKEPINVQAHVSGSIQIAGPTPDFLASLILQRKGQEALLRIITFPWFPSIFKKFRILRRIFHRNPFRAIGLTLRKSSLRSWIRNPPGSLTAEDWFALFYKRTLISGDLFSYFFYRFGQPRHLAALSLMTTFPKCSKPLLDLACGFGHLSHYLTECQKSHQVVGFDRNFFQLWVSKHWIAPKGHFLCGDADLAMPFKEGSFDGVLCSDAFHYFQNKTECVNEMRRCSSNGTIILTRVGNQLVQPNEGKELSPRGYLDLFSNSECRALGETALMNAYLKGMAPNLSIKDPAEFLNDEKWLSIIVSSNQDIFKDHGKFESWPHGVGPLGVNPIYLKSNAGQNRQIDLCFHFPSSWFEFENQSMQDYHPSTISIDQNVYQEIRNNQRTDQVNDLISKFVVIGMPKNYARSQQ